MMQAILSRLVGAYDTQPPPKKSNEVSSLLTISARTSGQVYADKTYKELVIEEENIFSRNTLENEELISRDYKHELHTDIRPSFIDQQKLLTYRVETPEDESKLGKIRIKTKGKLITAGFVVHPEMNGYNIEPLTPESVKVHMGYAEIYKANRFNQDNASVKLVHASGELMATQDTTFYCTAEHPWNYPFVLFTLVDCNGTDSHITGNYLADKYPQAFAHSMRDLINSGYLGIRNLHLVENQRLMEACFWNAINLIRDRHYVASSQNKQYLPGGASMVNGFLIPGVGVYVCSVGDCDAILVKKTKSPTGEKATYRAEKINPLHDPFSQVRNIAYRYMMDEKFMETHSQYLPVNFYPPLEYGKQYKPGQVLQYNDCMSPNYFLRNYQIPDLKSDGKEVRYLNGTDNEPLSPLLENHSAGNAQKLADIISTGRNLANFGYKRGQGHWVRDWITDFPYLGYFPFPKGWTPGDWYLILLSDGIRANLDSLQLSTEREIEKLFEKPFYSNSITDQCTQIASDLVRLCTNDHQTDDKTVMVIRLV